jgi:hypothetical protein
MVHGEDPQLRCWLFIFLVGFSLDVFVLGDFSCTAFKRRSIYFVCMYDFEKKLLHLKKQNLFC